MVSSRSVCILLALGCVTGCSLPSLAKGGACERSSECNPGLVCVSGKCSSDLSSIAAHDTVPMLGAGKGGASGAAGASGSAGANQTAGIGESDAAIGDVAGAQAGAGGQ